MVCYRPDGRCNVNALCSECIYSKELKKMDEKKGWVIVTQHLDIGMIEEKGYKKKSGDSMVWFIYKNGTFGACSYLAPHHLKDYELIDCVDEIPEHVKPEQYEMCDNVLHIDGVLYSEETVRANLGRGK